MVGIRATLAITWPQDVTCEEDSLAEAAQVNGNVGRPDKDFWWFRKELSRLATGREDVKASECHDKVF
jgi:hypothetical protein